MNENPILQTKIKDLESTLDDAILRGPEKYSHEEIEQKFAFIGKLVYAEAKSYPSQQLHHVTEKLESLRKSFNERDSTFTTFTNPEFDKDSISNSNSTCSCTESCLKDVELDGEELDESNLIVIDDPDKLFPDFVREKGVEGYRGNGVEENGEKIDVGSGKIGTFFYHDAEEGFEDFDKEKEVMEEKKELEKVKSGFGKNCCVLVSGVFIGMSLMGFIMVNFSGCFDEYVEQTSFGIPT